MAATGIAVPKQYEHWVQWAAKQTGLPEDVVAAQISQESGFNPSAHSSAGAEGIAQFIPSTWAEYGQGSPYNASDAFHAYAKYMRKLLKSNNGNIQDALSEYNSGLPASQSPAGKQYADTILKNAGQGQDITSGNITTTAATGSQLVQTGFFGSAGTFFAEAGAAVDWLLQPNHWIRIGCLVGGGFAVGAGVLVLAHSGGTVSAPYVGNVNLKPAALPVGIGLTGLGGMLLFVAFHNLPSNVETFPDLVAYLKDSITEGTANANAAEGGTGTGKGSGSGVGAAASSVWGDIKGQVGSILSGSFFLNQLETGLGDIKKGTEGL